MRLSGFLVFALLVSCGAPPRETRPPADPQAQTPRVRHPGRGLEERVNGVRVVHLSGTPEEMGEQMGRICGEDLRFLIDANLKKVPAIAKDLAAAVAKAKAHAAGIPDSQMRELRATAKAAGVDEDWMLVAASVIEVVEEARACAGVAAWGRATASHETLVGRNLDWFDFGKLHERGVVIVRHPDEGRATISCGFPGLPGILTGMNDAGVFSGDLVQYPRGRVVPNPAGIPVMSLQRLALESASNTDEALHVLETSPRTVPQNYLVADANGAAFVEADATRFERRPPCGETVAGTNWAEEERGKTVGDARFGRLCACLDPLVGTIGTHEIEESLGAANAGAMSVMSVVAAPARRALRVSIGNWPACKGPFVDLDGAALLAKDPR